MHWVLVCCCCRDTNTTPTIGGVDLAYATQTTPHHSKALLRTTKSLLVDSIGSTSLPPGTATSVPRKDLVTVKATPTASACVASIGCVAAARTRSVYRLSPD
uniref:Uncharacterized protein n=1 Tax=Volvariella volvacea TaxID=36659 RepID=A0A5H2QC92_9AGAR|nr:hypothetical protein [Volvariella volvacea]AYD91368.1 hypothetical protein [Volvariella volvacea]AYD91399.1 hypothetical protein [Volvariella volvacea]